MAIPHELTGRRFGYLVARSVARKNGHRAWLCDCDCGATTIVLSGRLLSGHTKSCGCKMSKRNPFELTGMRFGRLVAIEKRRVERRSRWVCICDCGTEHMARAGDLAAGKVLSCGCFNMDRRRECQTDHGLSGTPEYTVWNSIIARCENPKRESWPRYGGRGVKVCDRWKHSFLAFLEDVGHRPSPAHTIDRIDNNGHYEPGNVRWATAHEQSRNRRNNVWVSLAGERMIVTDAARRLGISQDALRKNLATGAAKDRFGVTKYEQE